MSNWLFIHFAIVLAALGLFGVHRLLLWMERKGWIYYIHIHPTPGIRGVMSTFQQIVEPEVRQVIEAKDQQKAEVDEHDPSDR